MDGGKSGRYGRSEERERVVELLREVGRYKAARRYELCGKVFVRLGCKICRGESRVRFSCNVRICRECAKRASAVMVKKIVATIRAVERGGGLKKGWSWKLLTVTLRKDDDVERRVRIVKREFANLWRRFWGKKGCGCVYAVELGKGDHVHIHALVYGPWVDVWELRRYWESRTGAFIIDIRAVNWGIHRVANYVVKYIMKEADGGEEERVNGLLAMERTRRVGMKGVFYGVRVIEVRKSICAFCFQWDGWVVLIPMFTEEGGVPILTKVIWIAEFG